MTLKPACENKTPKLSITWAAQAMPGVSLRLQARRVASQPADAVATLNGFDARRRVLRPSLPPAPGAQP